MILKSLRLAVGSWQLAVGSWQLAGYFIKPENTPMMYKIQATDIPLQAYLSAVGMTGRTAYFGLNRIGKPQKDGTLVVSTASGAVGGL